jgi:hypothetical protein
MRDAQRLMAPDIAFVWEYSAFQHAQQCALAGAITADKTNPFTRLDLKINAREQR